MKRMSSNNLSQKWNHTSSPIAKRKDQLQEKLNSGKITEQEKIELNNIQIEFLKDCIKNNAKDMEFIEQIFDEIAKIKKKNKKLQEKITLKNKTKIEKKPRIYHLRKGPKK